MRRAAVEGRDDSGLIAGILLAAGLSRRYGRQKLLEMVEGEPLVRRAARMFVAAGLSPVVVVVSPEPALRQALEGVPATVVENNQPELGISRSIARGLQTLRVGVAAALIGVCDQPALTEEGIRPVLAAYQEGQIVVPDYGDHRGNPVLFDRAFFGELCQLEGDTGGQAVIARHPDRVIAVSLPSSMGRDVDRPEDWER